ncbi:hypothetical protein PILCRDRAFT_591897 [Piloderma croceum F 1598]|uniref:Uncharacterized protein n=1 Tax=Piloderma croceum (strain F 1598) TaxID=765440 RepID=A0A0C3FEZ9_PILCF|nr:hypothetical protein PILCRDRAFT_591897 [Piloderma croceum F 1598]
MSIRKPLNSTTTSPSSVTPLFNDAKIWTSLLSRSKNLWRCLTRGKTKPLSGLSNKLRVILKKFSRNWCLPAEADLSSNGELTRTTMKLTRSTTPNKAQSTIILVSRSRCLSTPKLTKVFGYNSYLAVKSHWSHLLLFLQSRNVTPLRSTCSTRLTPTWMLNIAQLLLP